MEKATEETAFIRDKERKLYGWNREEEDNLCWYRFVQWDGKIKDNEKETYLLKHFAERYSAILHLIQHPKDIFFYASSVHKLVKAKK